MDDVTLLAELQPYAEKFLERHISTSKEWFPHTLVPWARGADIDIDRDWSPELFPLPDEVRSALFVNLLTEDNLPYYYNTINRNFGQDSPWGEWTRRWTAEEARHADVIRDYLTVSQALDPYELERARMRQMSGGIVPEPPNAVETMAYVALQELATRISHRNTGKAIEDPSGYAVMARVATDENHHYLFYRDITGAAIEVAPSDAVIAIWNQVRDFAMPGVGIDDFEMHARRIAEAEIYNLEQHHQQILVPVVLKHWNIENLENLSPEAEKARTQLIRRIERIGRLVERQKQQAAEAAAAAEVDLTEKTSPVA